ncbi:MAG: SIMPL domain-containing protein [Cellvibrionaceae bacterium]
MNTSVKFGFGALCLMTAFALFPLGASHAAEQPQVSSSAQGVIEAQPDIAIVSGRVTVQQDTPDDAVDSARRKLDRIIKALKNSGVDSNDLQAAEILVNPQYHYPRDKPRQLSGYQASASFTAKLRDISKLSSLYGVLFKAGATELQPTQFDFNDRETLELQAISKAVEFAKRKAQAGLEPLGQKVGDLLLLNVDTRWHQPPMYKGARMAMMAESDSSAPQVNVGNRRIEATVSTTFAIR